MRSDEAATTDERVQKIAEGFLFREARLLDDHQYDSWLELWDTEALYWVPSIRGDLDPEREVSIIYDDRQRIADRVFRLQHPAAHTFVPLPAVVRVVSNVEVVERSSTATVVCSAYVLVVSRRGESATVAARVTHRLVERNDSVRMSMKKVVLASKDEALRNLTFLP